MKERLGGIICYMSNHKLIKAGSCPFTGVTYDYCERCNKMIPIEETD